MEVKNMETEHIYVNGEEKTAEEVLAAAEKYAADQGFSERESLRLRLLSEELLGLLNGITSDDYKALFWIEGDQKKSRLHLNGKIDMTSQRREELLTTAKSGKNEAAVGIVGKIRNTLAVFLGDPADIVPAAHQTAQGQQREFLLRGALAAAVRTYGMVPLLSHTYKTKLS